MNENAPEVIKGSVFLYNEYKSHRERERAREKKGSCQLIKEVRLGYIDKHYVAGEIVLFEFSSLAHEQKVFLCTHTHTLY